MRAGNGVLIRALRGWVRNAARRRGMAPCAPPARPEPAELAPGLLRLGRHSQGAAAKREEARRKFAPL